MSHKQRTLKAPVVFRGKGLHTGLDVTMTINPADSGCGIRFRRIDLEGQPFVDALAEFAPARVVYISCNPETQVRDCRLLRDRGYRLRVVQPVDLLPHTDHVETVALLDR